MNNLEQTILEIKSHDIVEVISEHVELKNNVGLCPFHQDSKPSFSVNQRKQYFYCFGCGKGGDVIKFIMDIENFSFPEAINFLATRFGISAPTISEEEKINVTEKRLRNEILTETTNFYHSCLTDEVRQHLKNEWKFSDETINTYKIGFARGGLQRYMISKNYKLNDCIAAGVLKISRDNEVNDFFFNRITIPNIFCGNVVHIVGRNLTNSEPKYLNLPGQIEYFFNEGCLPKENIIIVEGPKDCITLLQNEYSAIGLYGTSLLHNKKVERIFSGCKNLFLCLDNDQAGRRAASEFAERFPDKIKIIELSNGKDVNDFFQHNTKADFDKLLTEAKDPVSYHINAIPADTPKSDLATRLDPVVKTCAKLSEPMREAKLNELKERFKLNSFEQKAYRDQINKYKKNTTFTKYSDKADKTGKAEAILTVSYPGVVDIVESNGKLYFLRKENNELKILSEIKSDGIIYLPPSIKDIPWKCPRAEEALKYYNLYEQGNEQEINDSILNEVVDKLKSTSELPSEDYYLFTAAWVLHTYFLEPIQFSPIICLFAVPATGKSRTGRGIINLAFHGITRETVRSANIIRDATDLKASLFFDISNFWKSAERNQCEDIILGRFEKGTSVSRVLFPDLGPFKDTKHYDIFGTTVIATNCPLDDKLDSRSITICMKDSKKSFRTDVKPENYLQLKEKLTAFRARYFDLPLPETEKPASGRLGDIAKPLRQMLLLIQPNLDEQFMSLIKIIEEERMNLINETYDAQILKLVFDLRRDVHNGRLPVSFITDVYNQGLPKWEQRSNHSMGSKLRSLGFSKARTNDGCAAIEYGTEQVESMMKKYGLGSLLENSKPVELPSSSKSDTTGYPLSHEPLKIPKPDDNENSISEVFLDFPSADNTSEPSDASEKYDNNINEATDDSKPD